MEYFYIINIYIILNVEIYFYQFNCEFSNAKSEIFLIFKFQLLQTLLWMKSLSIKILKR